MKAIIEQILKSVEKRDFLSFRKAHFKLVNLCRKFLFEADKKLLAEIYPEISTLLIRFYKTGDPEWPEVDRYMGGVEVLRGLIGNLKEMRTEEEAFLDVLGSEIDQKIMTHLYRLDDGVLSGQLAKELERSPNSLTNRLPNLEKKGLLIRAKRGKNSMLYLTAKGKNVGHRLAEKEQKIVLEVEDNEKLFSYLSLQGKITPIQTNLSFW